MPRVASLDSVMLNWYFTARGPSARDRRLEYRDGKGAGQEEGTEPTRGKDKSRDTPDDDYSL